MGAKCGKVTSRVGSPEAHKLCIQNMLPQINGWQVRDRSLPAYTSFFNACCACSLGAPEIEMVAVVSRAVLPFLPALFGAASAHTSAMDAMQPYFIMKGPISEAEMEAIVDRHRWQFRQFGGAALVLNCIPILSLLLAFCNTIAAAMWAADLELSGVDLTAMEAPAPLDSAAAQKQR